MLYGQGRKVGVRHKVPLYAGQGEELAEELCMTLAGFRYPHRFTAKPCQNLTPSARDGLCLFEHARVGHKPQERKQARPG